MTATVQTFPATVAERFAELDRARMTLLAELGDGSVEPPPSAEPGRWSIGEIAYHLHLVESRITGLLMMVLSSDNRQERASEEKLRAEWELTISRATDPKIRVNAPPGTIPENAPHLVETLALLEKSRSQLLAALQSVTIDDLASVSAPHPIEAIGKLTGAGWLSLIAHHEIRHTRQIRELKERR
jgi:hypothetical protein